MYEDAAHGEMRPCVKEPIETLKSIMENMTAILAEIDNQTDILFEAFYGRSVSVSTNEGQTVQENSPETILSTAKKQRDNAERILKKIVRIREGLW